jgi:hypothetical protein
MDKFLDTFDQLKLNEEDINHLNRPIASNDMEAVIKNRVFQQRNTQDLTDLL